MKNTLMPQRPAMMISQTLVRLAFSASLSFAILAILLHWLARSGDDVNLAMLYQALSDTPARVFTLYALLMAVNTVLRTLRYRLILVASNGLHRVSFFSLFIVTGVRNMVVDLLPARLGELVFVTMLKKGCGVPLPTGLAILAISFLLDIFMLALLLLIIGLLPFATPVLRHGSLPAALLLTLMLIAGVVVLWPGLRLLADRMRPWEQHNRIFAALARFLLALSDTLLRCRQGRILGRALLLTAGIRVLKYGALYLLFDAVAATPGLATIPADFIDVIVALVASEAGASLPLPTLMSFGTYEAGGAAVFALLGFPMATAVITLLCVHIASQVLDYLVGCTCLALFFLTHTGNLNSVVATNQRLASKWKKLGKFLAVPGLLLGIALVASQLDRVRGAHSQVPPPMGQAIRDVTGTGTATTAISRLNGWVVWSSNRFGNHEILKMNLADRSIRRLTEHPHAESFPRISPDGRKIVFARSRQPWVSLRNPIPWDVYLLDLESGSERLLAEFGNVPTWSTDGSLVYFQRRGSEFVQKNLASGVEQVLFKAGAKNIPSGVELQTPSLSAFSGRLASTWRGSRRITAIIEPDGTVKVIGKGCQLAWAPDDAFVYWVDRGGLMKNRVYRQVPGSGEPRAWLDLPAPYSHEYFPKLSSDGRYLVLGASAGGHEHDVADYEIFLWSVESPSETAVRLTFHSGNDNWPDVFVE